MIETSIKIRSMALTGALGDALKGRIYIRISHKLQVTTKKTAK